MIDLYTWPTPNGLKPLILLEELGLSYELHRVSLQKNEQRAPGFLALSPNGKIPAMIVDRGRPEEIRLFESGAILLHLAETHGRFLPKSGQPRAETLAWLMFQMGSIGPFFGQLHAFADGQNPGAKQHFQETVTRLYRVLDERLGKTRFLAGDEYSIADIASYKWSAEPARMGVGPETVPHVMRWLGEIGERPAVKRALAIPFETGPAAG